MPLEPNSVSLPCLRFTAPCPYAGDLAPVLARGLGLSPADVRTTSGGTGVLVPLSPTRSRRAAALARAFGLDLGDAPASRLSVAFLPRGHHATLSLPDWVSGLTGMDVRTVRRSLGRPGGLQLHDLPAEQVQDWRTAARGRPDVDVAVSDPSRAVHDLFGPVSADLARDLATLGVVPCPETGARAAGLDADMARWLARRHRVLPLDRAFQRFDLQLVCAGPLTPREAADFLGPRSGLALCDLTAVLGGRPATIERGLARDTALRFKADYCQIGLSVRLRLARGGTA